MKAPTRKVNKMQFRSRVLELLLRKQAEENRVISVQEITDATGLAKQTIYNWKAGMQFDQLDSDTAHAFVTYFKCDVCDLVELVSKASSSQPIA